MLLASHERASLTKTGLERSMLYLLSLTQSQTDCSVNSGHRELIVSLYNRFNIIADSIIFGSTFGTFFQTINDDVEFPFGISSYSYSRMSQLGSMLSIFLIIDINIYGLIYTLLLLFRQPWLMCSPKRHNIIFKWTRNTKLNSFMEVYHAPYSIQADCCC